MKESFRSIEALDRWINDHPVQAFVWTSGFAVLMLEVAMFLKIGIEEAVRAFLP